MPDKTEAFRALHRGDCFVMPNPWDAGSARLLAELGFKALATSSGAAAGVLGRRDGELTRDEAIAHARAIVQAVDLPVAADLENGFGDAPGDAALTIRLAGEIGLAGGSIEDCSGPPERRLYDFNHALERIAAAAEAARAVPGGFVLTARCENFLRGKPDLDDTIRRLQAYERAGADVLFAPGLPDLDAVRTVCSALEKPFNYMIGRKGASFSLVQLRAAGVRRISLATSLYRAAMAAARRAAAEAAGGEFGFVETL
jgi:2-methylisocitrate lyase-like PEP mutase family enzyme